MKETECVVNGLVTAIVRNSPQNEVPLSSEYFI